jgi:quinol monooxygenase YgiN
MILILAESLVASEADAVKTFAAAREFAEQTLREPGCFQFDFARDALNPLLIHVIERWKDGAAIDYHMKMPYLHAFMKALGDVQMKSSKVKVYDLANEREFDQNEFK